MQVALCQINPQVGAVKRNVERLLCFAVSALEQQAELMFSPELSLCGYPPKDLLFNQDFINLCQESLQHLAANTPIPMIVGASHEGFNTAIWCYRREVRVIARKRLLPNYQVFDEQRYFKPGQADIFYGFEHGDLRFGVSICEDAWNDRLNWYPDYPIRELVHQHQADILVNLMASPFENGKSVERQEMFQELAKNYERPLLVVGQVGANDGLIFDGGSLQINSRGELLATAQDFREELLICSLS